MSTYKGKSSVQKICLTVMKIMPSFPTMSHSDKVKDYYHYDNFRFHNNSREWAERRRKQIDSTNHPRLKPNEIALGIVWIGLPLIHRSWITKALRPLSEVVKRILLSILNLICWWRSRNAEAERRRQRKKTSYHLLSTKENLWKSPGLGAERCTSTERSRLANVARPSVWT